MVNQAASSQSSPRLSLPRIFLHLEGASVLIAALILYANQGFSWWTFALLLLAPDLSFLFYLINQRLGSTAYNLVHTLVFPLALAVYSLLSSSSLGLQLALIWLAHIGMDRMVGYGLKYPDQAKETHFSRL